MSIILPNLNHLFICPVLIPDSVPNSGFLYARLEGIEYAFPSPKYRPQALARRETSKPKYTYCIRGPPYHCKGDENQDGGLEETRTPRGVNQPHQRDEKLASQGNKLNISKQGKSLLWTARINLKKSPAPVLQVVHGKV